MAARLTIDLAAIVENYQALAAVAPMAAVVKADAYGMGAARVVPALVEAGCKEFFVATLSEALALNAPGPVYVFEGPRANDVAEYRRAGITPVLNHPQQLALWRNSGGGPACVHVDTGMQRLGFPPDELTACDFSGVEVRLFMTHYACADDVTHPMNLQQRTQFEQLAQQFPGARTSLANSAGVLNGAEWVGDLGRPGIALYGGNPFSGAENPMLPVAALEGQILQTRRVAARTAVGYGLSYVTEHDAVIATVGIGYADGVPRLLSNRGHVAVGDMLCPIVGRISMDALQIDATSAQAQVGDWVEVFGRRIDVDDAAAHAESFSYEMLTGVGSRPQRVYV